MLTYPMIVCLHIGTTRRSCEYASLCQNGARCIGNAATYSCQCPANFTGTYCQSEIDLCSSMTCLYNATCENFQDVAWCRCAVGYTGKQCESIEDMACSLQCANNASCLPDRNATSCACPQMFTGSNCEEFIVRDNQPSTVDIPRSFLSSLFTSTLSSKWSCSWRFFVKPFICISPSGLRSPTSRLCLSRLFLLNPRPPHHHSFRPFSLHHFTMLIVLLRLVFKRLKLTKLPECRVT